MLTTKTNLGLMLTMLVREVAMIGKPVQPFGAMFYAGQLRGMYIMLNLKNTRQRIVVNLSLQQNSSNPS